MAKPKNPPTPSEIKLLRSCGEILTVDTTPLFVFVDDETGSTILREMHTKLENNTTHRTTLDREGTKALIKALVRAVWGKDPT
jgi:uncharacterized membrane protein